MTSASGVALAWTACSDCKRLTHMGAFHVTVEIGDPAGVRFERLEVLVDTGATYTMVPRDVLDRLGVRPEEDWPFVLADGRQVDLGVAWVRLRLDGRTHPTIAAFGDPGTEPLLGVFTLEGFRLAADPVNRRLVPVPALLKTLGRTPSGDSRPIVDRPRRSPWPCRHVIHPVAEFEFDAHAERPGAGRHAIRIGNATRS
jgi:clan AA aspartic protease